MKIAKYLSVLTILLIAMMPALTRAQSYEFELQDINGNNVKLSSLLEKGPVMMSFWALWCVPCKEEMKEFNQIYKTYKDSGFVYVAVNQDNTKSVAKVKSYIESKSYDFLVLLDTDLHVFETYGGQNLPFSVLLNKKGEVAKTYTGYLAGDEKKIEDDILKVLKEPK
jgi:cytochrome c biogenesis protein CcmG, thiol:disulfide interchange protein DsbE